jgi:type II secretory pathway component PulF|uniref:Type II secretion system F family protein n=1 Tax=candidate division CPR3 bacterium TaxID=2268181 RepID=A0A7V3J9K2_UNCC3
MLYQYKAKDQNGVLRQGEVEAKNPEDIYAMLKKEGLFLLSLREVKPKKTISLGLYSGVSLKDLAVFTKQLQVMVQAGMSLVSALRSQGEQTENKKLAKIALQLASAVEGGKALSSALSEYPSVFSPLYINTVLAGETSGKLEEVLASLSDTLEKDYDLRSKIKGAMIYPAFILTALIAVVIIILIYVVPSLTKLFKELGGTLPLVTRILIKSSDFARTFWWAVLLGILGLIILLRLYKKTKTGAYLLDALKINLPIFGPLVRKIYMARFCRTASTLVKAGLPITQILKTAKSIITNSIYQDALEKVAKKVENGLPLALALKETGHFPTMVHQLIYIGEESGKLEESLDTLADYFEKEVTATTSALASLIEPILIVIIGIAVALIVFSVIKPIYGLTEIL